MKKLIVMMCAIALFVSVKGWTAGTSKTAPKTKVVETRINEADMDRLASAVNRAVKEAVIAKQGPSGFEYMAKRMKPPKNEKWQGKWNELGNDGWEAIDHFENIYIFKRAALGVAAVTTPRVKPAAAPAKAEPTVAPAEDKSAEKAAEKAVKEEEKAAKKAEKEKEKAAKKAEKDAKKAEKEKDKAAKKAEKEAKKKAE